MDREVERAGNDKRRNKDLLKYIGMDIRKDMEEFLKLINPESTSGCDERVNLKDGHIFFEEDTLNFKDSPDLVTLPKYLEIYSYFGALPALEIIGCHNFKILEYITVGTNSIFIENCHNFFEIGGGVHAEGGIEIEDVPSFEKISDDLVVESFLKISHAPLLKKIPELKQSSASVELKSCPLLEEIPDTFMNGKMRGSLEISAAASLSSLPEKLWLTGHLEIEDCPRIMKLPSELKIGGGLYLKKENSITTLPEELVVKGDVALMGCRFSLLPKIVEFGRDLYIHPDTEKDILDWIMAWKEQGMIKGRIIFST